MVTMETKTDVKPKQPMMENGPYLEKFEQFEKGAKDPAWVRVARKAGISHFVELGFPTLQDEDWRFTNVAPIAKLPFEPVVEPTRDAVAAKALNQFTFAGLSGSRIVFVNGHFAPELSSVAKLPDGVKVMSLAAALASDTALVEKHLFRHARADTNAPVPPVETAPQQPSDAERFFTQYAKAVQLVRQNGRLLLRLELIEKRLVPRADTKRRNASDRRTARVSPPRQPMPETTAEESRTATGFTPLPFHLAHD